jgi:hypothetical protein
MTWREPSDDELTLWRGATARVFESGELSICPCCSKGYLRYFFWRGDSPNPRGGLWLWCPECCSYEHSSVHVPEWWNDVVVPVEWLVTPPTLLDEHWRDAWLAMPKSPG